MDERERVGTDGGSGEFGPSLPRTLDEAWAAIEGTIAVRMLREAERPGWPTRGAYHALRRAARFDPIAAYDLGDRMARSAGAGPRRPRRHLTGLRLFERAAAAGMGRLLDASAPFERAPAWERELRDVVSRALTRIGAAMADAGQPEGAVTHFERAIRVFPGNADARAYLGDVDSREDGGRPSSGPGPTAPGDPAPKAPTASDRAPVPDDGAASPMPPPPPRATPRAGRSGGMTPRRQPPISVSS